MAQVSSTTEEATALTGKLAAEYVELRERVMKLEQRLSKERTEAESKHKAIVRLLQAYDSGKKGFVAWKVVALLGKMWMPEERLNWVKNGQLGKIPASVWLEVVSYVAADVDGGRLAAVCAGFGLPQVLLGSALAECATTRSSFIESRCRITTCDRRWAWHVFEDIVAKSFTGSEFEVVLAIYRDGDEAVAIDWADEEAPGVSFRSLGNASLYVTRLNPDDAWLHAHATQDSASFRLAASFRVRPNYFYPHSLAFEAFDRKGHFLQFASGRPNFPGGALCLAKHSTLCSTCNPKGAEAASFHIESIL